MVYRLTNASPNRVVSELSALYPRQRFISAATGKSSGMTQQEQSVIVSCDESKIEQIDIIMTHFDRKNTELIDIESVAKKSNTIQ